MAFGVVPPCATAVAVSLHWNLPSLGFFGVLFLAFIVWFLALFFCHQIEASEISSATMRGMEADGATYRIEQDDSSKRESFGNYTYRIYKDDRLIALYWHDFRGDEQGINFLNGTNEQLPFGRESEFIEGGGPEPYDYPNERCPI